MPMTEMGLSDKLKTELKNFFDMAGLKDEGLLKKFCDAVGTAVVQYIKENADIELQAKDIEVPAEGLFYNTNPITGAAFNKATTLSTRVK